MSWNVSGQSIEEWMRTVKDATDPCKVTDDYVPVEEERNNLCYLSMRYLIGWGMRSCDFAVIESMNPNPGNMIWLDSDYIPILAEYMWDHLMGEPDEPNVQDIEEAVRVIRDMLFGMEETVRKAAV